MRIIFIPLDDRPCNFKMPAQIAQVAEVKIKAPPRSLLGKFLKPGNSEGLIQWLNRNINSADVLIASMDMLAYGGLVASRTDGTSLNNALRRLNTLIDLKKKNPLLKIYLFSTIMRTSITVTSEEEKKFWKMMYRFAGNIGPSGLKGLQGRFLEIVKKHLEIRNRNLAVNKEIIKFTKQGYVDFVVIGKEDVAKTGMHKKEVTILNSLITKYNLKAKVKIITGADELGQMMVAKETVSNPKIKVIYSNPKTKNIVSLYEDIPISRVVAEHVEALGGKLVKEKEDLILYVNVPKDKQIDLFLEGIRRQKKAGEGVKKGVEGIRRLIGQGKRMTIADVAYCNGADPQFVKTLLSKIDITKLASFAGWNTTSNSIGSALAFGLVYSELSPLSSQLLLERFIDDYLYQSIVRPKILQYLKKKKINPYNLGGDWKKVEKIVNQRLLAAIRKSDLSALISQLSVSLPWPRVFEVEVDLG